MMTRKYFGTDGIRGCVGETPITPDFFMRLGYAAGKVFSGTDKHSTRTERPAVLIGKDTRISGYMLESALQAGLSAAGVDIYLAGPMPTPAVAYLTRALRLQAGIVISASHNPYPDNGIKFFSSNGNKLPDVTERAIEARLADTIQTVVPDQLGRATRAKDAVGRYIEFCKSTFPSDLTLRGLRMVVDCAHGATYHIAAHVFHELGADVIAIGNQPDGLNINKNFGVVCPQALQSAVKRHQANIGIAFDGDGDRMLMADAQGELYDGDQLLYIIAHQRHKLGLLRGGVVGTLMTNFAVQQKFEQLDIPFVRAKVGDRYVLELLQQKGWQLGGEGSGHIICLDKHSTGDGIISALQVLWTLQLEQLELSKLLHGLTLCPQVLINVPVPNGFDLSKHIEISDAVQQVEAELAQQGRVLLRTSGTEPVVRVMVEAQDQDTVNRCAQFIADTVQQIAIQRPQQVACEATTL